jgi:DNA-binding winged helix-turn-helix (wHTH) protein
LLYVFDDYALDIARRELRRGATLLPVEPQIFDLIAYLIANRERVVSKEDLRAAVWQGRIVSESTVSSSINAARTVIGDNGEQQRLIRTLPRKGFRFIGTVTEAPAASLTDQAGSANQQAPAAPDEHGSRRTPAEPSRCRTAASCSPPSRAAGVPPNRPRRRRRGRAAGPRLGALVPMGRA